MGTLEIFLLQLFYSIVVWALIARWLFAPWLAKLSLHEALFWLVLPHAFRHIGMTFLVPSLHAGPLAPDFANPAAYGDLASSVLAVLILILLRAKQAWVIWLVWIFNIVGTLDLVNALSRADMVPFLGTTWYIPTFFVPLLLVTHFMIFVRLIRKKS